MNQRLATSSCAVLLAGLLTTGCYTTKNVVAVAPLETKYPVSASGAFVDSSGGVVDQKQYTVVAPFSFERTVETPRHSTTETRFELEPELNRIVSQQGGDAVTDLKIEGVGYDNGSHSSAAFWKQWGWGFGITGGTLLLVGAADADLRGTMVPAGAIVAGIGALGFVFAAVANDPAAWKFKVSGNVVKRAGTAPASVDPAAAAR